MKRLLFRLVILLTFFRCLAATAQESATPIPQVFSPNAMELGRYGKIPVDYANGLPNIQIPLTALQAKGDSIPVYLAYHASGNRPDIHPGWAGQGWSLHAGGCINRIVHGMRDDLARDEEAYLTQQTAADDPGYLFHCTERQAASWTFPQPVSVDFAHDYEPDEFQVCLDGINASFYITDYNRRTGQTDIKIASRDNDLFRIDVALDSTCTDHVLFYPRGGGSVQSRLNTFIRTITLTTSLGVRYEFGNQLSAIEFSHHQHPIFGTQLDPWSGYPRNTGQWRATGTANTWLLSKITYPNGETVRFSYQKEGVLMTQSDVRYHNWYAERNDPFFFYLESSVQNPRASLQYSYDFTKPAYLTGMISELAKDTLTFSRDSTRELRASINRKAFHRMVTDTVFVQNFSSSGFRFVTIDDFIRNTRYCQLSEIRHGARHISFNYSDSYDTRLKLYSIHISDGGSNQDYSFDYNPLALPSYGSKQTDAWGYYNGTDYGQISVVYQENDRVDRLASARVPNSTKIQAEILTRITYPTKGTVSFTYECNSFSKLFDVYSDSPLRDSSGLAGGLRIREITTNNGKTTRVRRFHYNNDGSSASSGTLCGKPVFFSHGNALFSVNYVSYSYLIISGTCINSNILYTLSSELPLVQIRKTLGNDVTYSRVTEEFEDGSTIVYRFTDFNDAPDFWPEALFTTFDNRTLYDSYNSGAQGRGLLKSRSYYTSSGRPVRREDYSYNHAADRYDDFVKSCAYESLLDNKLQRKSFLRLYTFHPYLESVRLREYPSEVDTSLHFDLTKYFQYNAGRQVRQIDSNSPGLSEAEIYRYAGDIPDSTCLRMKACGMTGIPIEHMHIRDGILIEAGITPYRRISRDNHFVPTATYRAELSGEELVDSWDGGALPSRYTTPEYSYLQYDDNDNLLEYEDRAGKRTCIIWGYGGMYPVAVVDNVSLEQLGQYTLGQYCFPDGLPQYIEKQLRSSGLHITTYKWEPHVGLLSITDPSGRRQSFSYDSAKRLEKVFNSIGVLQERYGYNYSNTSGQP